MDVRTAFVKASAICARQEKCISDIATKLQKWEVDIEDQHKVIDQLLKEKFIDEERYARFYVKDKFVFNRWGRIKIKYQLSFKGIDKNVIEDALSLINPSDYIITLAQLLHHKSKTIKHEDPYKRKNALIRFAAGRGFEPNHIYNVLDDMEESK